MAGRPAPRSRASAQGSGPPGPARRDAPPGPCAGLRGGRGGRGRGRGSLPGPPRRAAPGSRCPCPRRQARAGPGGWRPSCARFVRTPRPGARPGPARPPAHLLDGLLRDLPFAARPGGREGHRHGRGAGSARDHRGSRSRGARRPEALILRSRWGAAARGAPRHGLARSGAAATPPLRPPRFRPARRQAAKASPARPPWVAAPRPAPGPAPPRPPRARSPVVRPSPAPPRARPPGAARRCRRRLTPAARSAEPGVGGLGAGAAAA